MNDGNGWFCALFPVSDGPNPPSPTQPNPTAQSVLARFVSSSQSQPPPRTRYTTTRTISPTRCRSSQPSRGVKTRRTSTRNSCASAHTRGGFATGNLRAGGELAHYERALATEALSSVLGCQPLHEGSEAATMRSAANRNLAEHDAGIERLLELLHSQKYRANVRRRGLSAGLCLALRGQLHHRGSRAACQSRPVLCHAALPLRAT